MSENTVRGAARAVKYQQLIGQRFGNLVVTGIAPVTTWTKHVMVIVDCDCGNAGRIVRLFSLRSWTKRGRRVSCGCVQKHGMKHSRTYESWESMRRRCKSRKHCSWPQYGGRGIRVCDQWNDFRVFLRDMGERPPGTSLDRIDNSRGYEPGNCRWATPIQQGRNQRTNRIITFNGVSRTLSEWTEVLGFACSVLSSRLQRGWSVEATLTTPTGFKRRCEPVAAGEAEKE